MNPMKPSHEDETDGKFLHQVKEAFEPTTGTPGSTKTVLPAHPPTPEPLPERIGPYQVRRLIASGGMGVVYEALQDHPRRSVALKVMRRGVTSRVALRRFEHESQLLGRLRHTGIAQVYDAGTHHDVAGPLPYFAMEYIPNARPITEYVREKKLSTRRKLELFIQVCDAVHHGHLKGIVHRDLKPGNILVDATGQVKIIDFGVARSTDSDMIATSLQTGFGELVGTLKYMSPEQCAGDSNDIDVRSDVYALGVVLYEMLSGRLPYDLDNTPMLKAPSVIRETPPVHLGKIDRTFRGDIETIVETALEKEPGRRFQSVLAFKEDIERFLRNEPILVRRASAIYRLGRFAKRQRIPLGIAAAVTVMLGFAGAAYIRAAYAEARLATAVRVAEDALEVGLALQQGLLNPEIVYRRRSEPVQQGIAECTRLIKELPEVPWPYAVRARLQFISGNLPRARSDVSRALSLNRNDGMALRTQGRLLLYDGRFEDALSLYEAGMRTSGPVRNSWEDHHHRARLYRLLGDYEAALHDHDRAIELAPFPSAAWVHQSRGVTLRFAGRIDDALNDWRRAATLSARLHHHANLWIWETLMLRNASGDAETAREALVAARSTVDNEFDRMIVDLCLGDVNEEALLSKAKDLTMRFIAYYYLGSRALVAGRREEAVGYFQKCLETGVHTYAEMEMARWHLRALGVPVPSLRSTG